MQNWAERKQFAGLHWFKVGHCGLAPSSKGVKVLPLGRKGLIPVPPMNVVQVEPALCLINTRFLHSICKRVARLKVFTHETFLIMCSTALILIFIFSSYVNTRGICVSGLRLSAFKSAFLWGGVGCCPGVRPALGEERHSAGHPNPAGNNLCVPPTLCLRLHFTAGCDVEIGQAQGLYLAQGRKYLQWRGCVH